MQLEDSEIGEVLHLVVYPSAGKQCCSRDMHSIPDSLPELGVLG